MSETPHIKNIFSAEEEDCLSLEQMIAYRDGKLSAGEKHFAERHLLNCELCEMAYEGIAEEGEAVVQAGAAAIADAAWQRVAEREKKRRRGAWVWISAAASIVMIITVGLIFFRGPSDETMPEVAQQYYRQPLPPPLAADDNEDSAALALGKDSPSPEPKEFAENTPPSSSEEQVESVLNDVDSDVEIPEKMDYKLAMGETMEDLSNSSSPDDGGSKGAPMRAQTSTAGKEAKETSGVEGVSRAPGGKNAAPVISSKDAVKAEPSKVATADTRAKNQNTSSTGMDQGDVMDDAFADLEMEEESLSEIDEIQISDFSTQKQEQTSVTVYSGTTVSPQLEISDVKTHDRGVFQSKKSPKTPTAGLDKGKALSENRLGRAEEESAPADGNSAGLSAAEKPNVAPASNFAQGMEKYRAGSYAESAAMLRKASAETPANLQAHYYAAASFMNIEQPQAAIYHLDRILAQPGNSLYADAEWYKALAYLKLKDRKNAIDLLKKISAEGGKHAEDASKALKDL